MKDKYRPYSRLLLFGSVIPLIQTLRRARIVFLLLALCSILSILFAEKSKDNEILAQETRISDMRNPPDDEVIPLKYQSEFVPDKDDYAEGELLTIHARIWVDKDSRGYKPDRIYYLQSKYTEGRQLESFVPRLCWTIIKSDIDTLEIITDDRILEGDITMQLLRLNGKPQVKMSDSGVFMTLVPPDTTYTKWGHYSAPIILNFNVYRIYQRGVSHVDRQFDAELGNFVYDLEDTINMYGKRLKDKLNKHLNYNDRAKFNKNNTYLPEPPDYREMAMGGFLPSPRKVLRNSTLEYKRYARL